MVLSRYSEKLEFATHNTLSCNNRHVFILYFIFKTADTFANELRLAVYQN